MATWLLDWVLGHSRRRHLERCQQNRGYKKSIDVFNGRFWAAKNTCHANQKKHQTGIVNMMSIWVPIEKNLHWKATAHIVAVHQAKKGHSVNSVFAITPCLIGAWPGITPTKNNSIPWFSLQRNDFGDTIIFTKKKHPARPSLEKMSFTYHVWKVNSVKECDLTNIFLHIHLSSR